MLLERLPQPFSNSLQSKTLGGLRLVSSEYDTFSLISNVSAPTSLAAQKCKKHCTRCRRTLGRQNMFDRLDNYSDPSPLRLLLICQPPPYWLLGMRKALLLRWIMTPGRQHSHTSKPSPPGPPSPPP